MTVENRIKVIVADDSPTSRQLLVHLINHTTDMEVLGEAQDGLQVMRLLEALEPDILLMDIIMPNMDGLEATRQIMRTKPVPIVLITGTLDTSETDIAFRAMRAGALSVLQKPAAQAFRTEGERMLNTLRTMATVKVIHHWQPEIRANTTAPKVQPALANAQDLELVAIVSSTGGPAALNDLLKQIPADFPLPFVIAQHITPEFVHSLAGWLNSVIPMKVQVAVEGQRPQPGNVYLAPGDQHLIFDDQGYFRMNSTMPARYTPSGDILLNSVAKVFGSRAVGVVLTGMGDDGAQGLRQMYDKGALTIAQDRETSVVYGMPQEAVKRGGVREVLPILSIGQYISNLRVKGKT
jgi:two-component system chemotaxis response regulator CheB